jgi:hypothetical protein
MAEFFTSYARADDANRLVRKFVTAVEGKVRSLTGLPETHEIGFFDVRDIRTGNEWREVLAAPLESAKVLICMTSPTYVTRPVCSKEFAVFLTRFDAWKRDYLADWRKKNPGSLNHPSFIILLEWEKFQFGAPPPQLSKLQFSGDFPEDYKKYGLRDFLLFKKPTAKAYVDLVKAVSLLIVSAIKAEPALPPCKEKPDFDKTPNLFEAPLEPTTSLAQAVAAMSAAGSPGEVRHDLLETSARESGIPFESQPVLGNQPGAAG